MPLAARGRAAAQGRGGAAPVKPWRSGRVASLCRASTRRFPAPGFSRSSPSQSRDRWGGVTPLHYFSSAAHARRTHISFSIRNIIPCCVRLPCCFPSHWLLVRPPPRRPPQRISSSSIKASIKTPVEEALARQLAENDCKAKAISASAVVHKEIAADKMRLIGAAQKKGDEEYAATFTACMNRAGIPAQGQPNLKMTL